MCKNLPYLLILILISLKSVDCSCIHGDVRLVGGSGNYEGNVQVCIDGVWGYVCYHSWDNNDAKVVCRQLGYYTTDVSYRHNSYYGFGTYGVPNWMNYVQCTGSEDRLIDCPIAYGGKIGRVDYCHPINIAGVYCAFGVGGSNCTNGDIRLALRYSYYKYNGYLSRSEGRVEICYNNEWGTVCSNGWDSTDADVVCKQLGYTGHIAYFTSFFEDYGTGSGSIWLDDLNCTDSSSQTNLLACPYSTVTSDCTHSNDTQLRCYTRINSSCTDGDAKLWSAYSSIPDDEGIPLVCIGGTWYPMTLSGNSFCSYKLVCITAGFTGLLSYNYYGGQYYGYYSSEHYEFTCASSHTNLTDCPKSSKGNDWMNSVRLKCYTAKQTATCTDGNVRLTNGKAPNEGRVEYCYKSQWAQMCSLNQYTAALICKQLGYGNVSNDHLIITTSEFGLSDTISEFNYLYCFSTSASLSDCTIQLLSSSSSCTQGSVCYTHYGLRCYEPINECTDGDTRLVDGQIEQEGRPEVCVNGIWSQICDNEWDSNDAYVICVTMGYVGSSDPTVYLNSEFGAGYGPVVWDRVDCNHWVTNIHGCSRTTFPDFSCDSYKIAGVRCTEGCTDGEVRLVGGNSVHEGTVEICYDELWGLISDDGWNEIDAKLVCKQLGYTGDNVKPQLGSLYGKPNKTIHLKDISCTNQDSNLLECDSTQLTIADGKELWFNIKVAGVHCLADASSIDCNEGSVRLVNGSIESEGRVEVCAKGKWGTVCEIGWDGSDGHVICHQLGYTKEAPIVYYDSYFGNGSHPIVYTNVNCKGWEDSISDCDKDDVSVTCHYTAGLRCKSTADDLSSAGSTNDDGSSLSNIAGVIGLTLGAVALVGLVLCSIIFILMFMHFIKSSKRSMQVLPEKIDVKEKN